MSESFRCYFCGHTKAHHRYHCTDIFGDPWAVVTCDGCATVNLSPHPTGEQLSRAYDESYYGQGKDKFGNSEERVLDYFRKRRAKRLLKFTGRGKRILDIGCGNGRFLKKFRALGDAEIFGLEMPGASADRAALIPHLNLKTGALTKGDYPNAYFDAITLFHVFEHLEEPAEYLDIIDEILIPGGALMISFPNIGSWQARFFKDKWLHLDPPRHLFFMQLKNFKDHMAGRGYSVLKEKHFCPEYNPFGTQQSLLNLMISKRDLLYEHLKGNAAYAEGSGKTSLFFQKQFYRLSFPMFVAQDAMVSVFRQGGTVEFILRKSS